MLCSLHRERKLLSTKLEMFRTRTLPSSCVGRVMLEWVQSSPPLEFLAESPLNTSAISPVPVTKHGFVARCIELGTGAGDAAASNRVLCPTFITAQLCQPWSQTAATDAAYHWPHMTP